MKPVRIIAENSHTQYLSDGTVKLKTVKTLNVHGVELPPIKTMVFNKWCSNNNVAMNTLTPEQRKEVVEMFLKQADLYINQ